MDFKAERETRNFTQTSTMSGSQLPMIFQTADLVFEDRVSAYKNDILGLCKPHEVSERIGKYIAQNVEASGWQAVWRSTPKSSGLQQPFDVVVEVKWIFSLWNLLRKLVNYCSFVCANQTILWVPGFFFSLGTTEATKASSALPRSLRFSSLVSEKTCGI